MDKTKLFVFFNIDECEFGKPFPTDKKKILVPDNCVLYEVKKAPRDYEEKR